MGDESRLTPLQDVLARIAVIVGGASVLGVAGLVGSLWLGAIADHSALLGLSDRVDAHSRRLDTIEQRPPRLSESVAKLRTDVDRIEAEQRACREATLTLAQASQHIREIQNDLCKRLRACDELWRAMGNKPTER